jgi:hypothetical protein
MTESEQPELRVWVVMVEGACSVLKGEKAVGLGSSLGAWGVLSPLPPSVEWRATINSARAGHPTRVMSRYIPGPR